MSINDIHSLSHSKWNCKYHIVFAPKYRRRVFYGEKKEAIGKILRQLCEWKGVNIIEAEACPDHIHMLVEIPPKNAHRIQEYIKHQLDEDKLGDQLRIPGVDPKKSKK